MRIGFRLACLTFAALASSTLVYAQVTVSSFSPGFGAPGDSITINGTGFYPGTPVVKFNGVTDTTAKATTTTLIQAKVPVGATTGRISVQNGTSTGTSISNFVVIGSGPYVTDFTPSVGSDFTSVELHGVHFTTATNCYFAGVPASSFFVSSDTLITMTAPAGVISGPLSVRSPLGNYTTTTNFDVPPIISGFSPTSGRVGTNVIVSGTNLLDTFAVWVGGDGGAFSVSASFTVLSNRAVRVTMPAGVATGQIRVDAPAGSYDSANLFFVPPTLSGFTPQLGAVGMNVTITGANFTPGPLTVRFNGTAAAISGSASFGQVTVVVPAGATSGPISVTTTNGTDTSTSNFLLPATISGFTPNHAPAGTWITVNGQNFLGATAASFNGLAATAIRVTNNTTLGVQVPAGVITGPISVTTPVNTATNAALFYGAPLITGFSPGHGAPGTSVTITGTNFLGVTAVRFNGVAGGIVSGNNGSIVATVPGGAQSGPISVVTPGGTNTSSSSFVVDYPTDMAIWATPAPYPATIGSNVTFTVTIVNNGPNSAPNVLVTNTLDPAFSFKSATINQGSVSNSGNLVIGTLGTMGNGAAATLIIKAVPNAIGSLTDTMTVTSDAPDPTPFNNTYATNVLVLSLPLVSIQNLTNQFRIWWPADLTNYVLQAKNSMLTNIYFSNVTTTPLISGNQASVFERNTNASRFYRLKK